MPTALCVTLPLLLAAVLVVSAVGKLRTPERARDAFTAMGVPSWLNRPIVVRAHPWAEIGLAALLLVVPGPLGAAMATVALLLMLTYLVLVAKALRNPADVDCGCFGSIGGDRVTVGTVVRNVWLTLLAVTTLLCALEGSAVSSRVAALTPAELWWVAGIAASAITTALVMGTGRSMEAEQVVALYGDDEALDEYVRTPIPAVNVLLGDGSETDLRQLSAQKAQLLLFISETCGTCTEIITLTPAWRDQLPEVDIRHVVARLPEEAGVTSSNEPRSLHDVDYRVRDSFGLRGTPGALLLGADGLLAGGPVLGAAAVKDFVEEISTELAAARSS